MTDAAFTPVLPLDVREVFVEYDGPQLFSCHDANGNLYLVQSVDEDDVIEQLLLCPVQPAQLVRLAAGTDDLRAAYDGSYSPTLFVVKIPFDAAASPSVESVLATAVSQDWVPEAGVLLLDDADAAQLVNSQWVGEAVEAEEPAAAAMSMRLHRKDESFFSLRELSGLLSTWQSAIDAVGQRLSSDNPSNRGRIATSILDRTEMKIAAVGTGSVRVDLVAQQDTALIQSDLASNAVAALFDVLRDLSVPDASLQSFKWLHLRAKLKVKELLEELAWSEASVETLMASPQGRAAFSRLTEEDISTAVRHINLDQEIIKTEFSVVAKLVGANVRTRRFEAQATDESEQVYTGKVTAASRYKMSGAALDGVYRITLVEYEIPDVSGEVKRTFELVDLEQLSSPDSGFEDTHEATR